MKLFFLTAFGMMMAMSAAQQKVPSNDLEAQLLKLQQLMDARTSFLAELSQDSGGEGLAEPNYSQLFKSAPPPSGGLKSGTLRTGSLESGGVQSGARGLTPEANWRKMFPHKPGYSR